MFSRFSTLLVASTALVPLGLAIAVANPQGPQVVGGSATVQGQGTSTVTVTQQTNSAIINWNTFNIGTGEKTNIFQPSSSSVQLDRVTGGLGPSQILGSLWSNGRVFLVNPDGILFGSGAKVDAAGFLATTNDIANADFMAGRYNFLIPGTPSASIVNQGTITAQSGGFAALVAPGVRNSGTITANLGTIALASGNAFTLDFYGDKLITLGLNDSIAATVTDVATGQPLGALVKNEGTLKANGGRVELTAASARQVVDSVINTTGVIEANTIGTHNGMIVLSAATASSKPAGAPTQTVKVSGTLSAAGKAAGTKGGTIQVTGENILVAGAAIDASGVAGGGRVMIGGDVGGGNPSLAAAAIPQAQLQSYAVPTASNVTVDAATTINASATGAGDGGKVVVWSEGATSFNGSILARGGANAGNGGFVETSGHTLDFTSARVDTSAPNGRSGSWLLDPFDLTIDSAAATTIATSLATTNVTIQTTASGSSGPGISNPSGNGDIFVNSGISWSSANSLTLSAYRNIAINAAITAVNGGLVVNALNTITATGAINLAFFTIQNGAWSQVATSLPNFAATDFRITGGTFLRALGGDGSAASPYQIADVYGLQGIGSPSNMLLNKDFVLANDINASGTASWNGTASFVPIGEFGGGFTGQLDGAGRTISNLKIAPTATNISEIGLFGQIYAGGVVQNLNLTNVDIQANPNLGTGFHGLGALAGLNSGLVVNVTASGTINGGTFSDVTAGGLVGQNGGFNSSTFTGTIQNSSAAVNVTLGNGVGCSSTSCSTNLAGGLVGQNGGTITGSSASGTIVVGANSQAGGLVGGNYRFDSNNNPVAGALIDQSFATGNVSSAGVNVSLGGLVGFNFTGALITSSYATGNVTATHAIASNNGVDCSTTNSCQYESAGGLVGQNSGTIQGAAVVPSVTQACGAGQTCAIGAVSVGSHGQGGGLTGQNDGIIENAFATGAVTGAAGIGGGVNDHGATSLGGLSANNNGLITNSFATGNVGTLNVTNLNVGGLVSDNSGTILNSTSTGNVSAGAYSNAGGLTSDNSGNFNCTGCNVGDGNIYFNSATISNSHATGNVTVGAASLAGGLTGSTDGTIKNTSATGAVIGGGNSILGGLIGVADITAKVTNSTTAVTSTVTSTGPNSYVGGFIGVNGGTINGVYAGSVSSISASGPVTGTSDSLLGGFVALNFGVITNATTAVTSTVSGSGANNYVGGFVGANFGMIDPSTSAGNVTGGTNNFVGSFAGTNASLTGYASNLIPGSSFPTGTITNSVGTGTVNSAPATPSNQVGTSNPTTFPATPSIVATCNNGGLCSILLNGLTLPPLAAVNYSVADVFSTYGTVATVGAVTLTGAPNGVTATVTVFSVNNTNTPITLTANTPAGSYTEVVTGLSNPSYTIASSGINTNGTLTISPATLTYTANTASRTYGAVNPLLNGTVCCFVAGDTQASATTGSLSFSTTATPSSNVGSYAITGSGLTANNGNYTLVQATANATALTVNPATLTVAGSKIYDTTTGFSVGQLSVAGGVNGETVTLTGGTATAATADVGTASGTLASPAISVSGGNAAASNYTLPATGALTISPATLTYTANTAIRTYGAVNPLLNGTVCCFVPGDTQASATTGSLSFSTTATPSSNVGSYAITGSGLTANNGNYTLVQATANATALTVNPAALTVAGSKIYDTTTDFSVGQLSVAGGVNGETVTLTGGTATAATANVGTASGTLASLAISVSGGNAAASNYTLPATGALTIDPATLLYVANPASIAPGDAIPPLTGTVRGFVAGDSLGTATTGSLIFLTTATLNSNVGSYVITGSGLIANTSNYVFSQPQANATAFTIAASTTPPPPPPPPPVTQINPPANIIVTTPPVILASLTPPSTPAGSPPVGAGSYANATPGKPSFIPPPLPGRSVPGPNGETRSFIPPIGETRLVSNQLILQFGNLSAAEIASLAQSLGLQIIGSETIMGRRLYTVQIPNGRNLRDLFGILDNNANVSAAPMYKYTLNQIAAATGKGDPAQYLLGKLHLVQAHTIATGKGITIALIDSEVDKRHSELQGTISSELDTLGVNEPLPSHGTEMAGAIGSHDRLMGVAPDAKILAVRAFGESNSTAQGTTLSILKGIEWAVSQGARIINMSFAGPRDPSLERAFKAAHDKGIVLIAAAGNAGPKSPPLYPGADPNVIAVTATDARDRVFRGANQGPQLSVAAPGVDIIAPAPAGGYQMSTGTSIATAHVSGVVALMLERDPTLKPDDVRKILESTATGLGSKGKNGQFGWGLVNPPKALEAVAAQIKSSDASSKKR